MIDLVKDTISDIEMQKVADWLTTSPRLTKGPLTLEFEKAWSSWQGCEYSVFVNSGSSANFLMMLALLQTDRLKNKTVVVPAVSWITTASPLIHLGFNPILCDCDNDDLGLDIEDFEKLCKEHSPSAVVLVHVLGHANKMDKIRDICDRYNVLILEDCCEAHGARIDNEKVGNFGLMSTFSFYFGHHMSTIEGGMICTSDRELYNILVSLRSHGWVRDMETDIKSGILQKYDVDDFQSAYFFVYPGMNVRSTDLNAFIGLLQLENLDETIDARYRNYQLYYELLNDVCHIQNSESSIVSSLALGLLTPHRDRVAKALIKNQVECRPLICGSLQRHPFWYENYPVRSMPNAERVHKHGLYIPCHQAMTNDDIRYVANVIRNSVSEANNERQSNDE